jgi:glycosyltransferase involved in cell wall biosynthesis
MQRTIKLHFVENFSEGESDKQLEAMGKVFELTGPEEADVFYCASIFKLQDAIRLQKQYNKPTVVYCWDYYKWVHDGNEYVWRRYADFMKEASLIFVPSHAQQLRLKELLDLDSVVVPTGIPEYKKYKVTDGNFILDPVRYYPEENGKWAEKAAEELGIPIVHSEHQFTEDEFRQLVASCTFMTCVYREASTGGLTLMEGMRMGKPALVSDSPYMGARDYLGDKGYYFKYDDFEDLKKQMKSLWEKRPKVKDGKKYVDENFNYDVMAQKLKKHICDLKKS